ncbi:unnamed protein product [Ilex paraguariensis]|uniref:Uncharacterized protein n=1 Tax=Ilex paraguariensis TaxID=185542 RepID=A0ABC8RC97_9AQUA
MSRPKSLEQISQRTLVVTKLYREDPYDDRETNNIYFHRPKLCSSDSVRIIFYSQVDHHIHKDMRLSTPASKAVLLLHKDILYVDGFMMLAGHYSSSYPSLRMHVNLKII